MGKIQYVTIAKCPGTYRTYTWVLKPRNIGGLDARRSGKTETDWDDHPLSGSCRLGRLNETKAWVGRRLVLKCHTLHCGDLCRVIPCGAKGYGKWKARTSTPTPAKKNTIQDFWWHLRHGSRKMPVKRNRDYAKRVVSAGLDITFHKGCMSHSERL